MKLPQVSDAEWVMHIDADEYLNVEVGNRQIDDLLSLYPKADVIAVLWRHFGSARLKIWDGGSVIDRFTRCEDKLPDPDEGGFSAFNEWQPYKADCTPGSESIPSIGGSASPSLGPPGSYTGPGFPSPS